MEKRRNLLVPSFLIIFSLWKLRTRSYKCDTVYDLKIRLCRCLLMTFAFIPVVFGKGLNFLSIVFVEVTFIWKYILNWHINSWMALFSSSAYFMDYSHSLLPGYARMWKRTRFAQPKTWVRDNNEKDLHNLECWRGNWLYITSHAKSFPYSLAFAKLSL